MGVFNSKRKRVSAYTIVAMPILIVSDLLRLGLIVWEDFPGRHGADVFFQIIVLPTRWLSHWLPYDGSNIWLTELEIVCILCVNAYIWALVVVTVMKMLRNQGSPLTASGTATGA